MTSRLKKPSPAMLVACLALFVAFTGSAVAAGLAKNSVTSKQVKNSSLTGSDIKNDSLSGKDVKESSLAKVPAAGTADSAASAGSLSGRTITDANVVAHSLGVDKVAHAAGTFEEDFGAVSANDCDELLAGADPAATNMQDDAIAVTVEDNWPSGLSISTENSNSNGYVRLNVCNVTGSSIDPPLTKFHFVAFSVPGN